MKRGAAAIAVALSLITTNGAAAVAESTAPTATDAKQQLSAGAFAAATSRLQNLNSLKCLLIQGTANDAPAVQYNCTDYADEKWTFEYVGLEVSRQYWRIRNVNSGKCLVARGYFDDAVQSACANYADQHWFIDYDEYQPYVRLINRNSRFCLTAKGTANGTRVGQSYCDEFADEWWYMV